MESDFADLRIYSYYAIISIDSCDKLYENTIIAFLIDNCDEK